MRTVVLKVKVVRRLAIALSFSILAVSCTNSTPDVASSESPSTSTEASQTQQPIAQSILIDGFSTVYPLTDEPVKEYQFEQEGSAPQFTVAFSRTTGGFRKFCAGETDISNTSRPITTEEMAACKAAGIQYIELPVAFDALTVVVHPNNTWAQDITVEELKRL